MMLYHRSYFGIGDYTGRLIGHPFAVWGVVLAVLALAALIVLVVLSVKNRKQRMTTVQSNTPQNNAQALDILNVKFAQGEISEEEYLKRKQVLSAQ
jgi:putative membrane protein